MKKSMRPVIASPVPRYLAGTTISRVAPMRRTASIWHRVILITFLVLALAACDKPRQRVEFPAPLRPPAAAPTGLEIKETEKPKELETKFIPGPPPPSQPPASSSAPQRSDRLYAGESVALNIESLPLPAFINEVYGNILKSTFEIAPQLREVKDLVTVRTADRLAPAELDALARQVLANYGVGVEQQGALLRFVMGKEGVISPEPPLLVSGKTLPDVPITHRPIFQLVQLNVVSNAKMADWINQAYKGYDISVLKDPTRNGLLLMGSRTVLAQVLDAVAALDQPGMKGRSSLRVEPVYLDPEELASALVDTLSAEGYAASLKVSSQESSVIVVPLRSVGAVLVFASDPATLAHARKWVASLDSPGQGYQQRDETGIFFYSVQNTKAAEIFSVLSNMVPSMDRAGEEEAGSGVTTSTGSLTGSTASLTSPTGLTGAQSSPFSSAAGGDFGTPRTLGSSQGLDGSSSMQGGTGAGSTLSSVGQAGTGAVAASVSAPQVGQLVMDPVRNALIFQGRRKYWNQLLAIIREMDKRPRMVLIEVTVAEITLEDSEELGIEWLFSKLPFSNDFFQGGGSFLKSSFGTLGTLGAGTEGFNFRLNNAGTTRALLNALATMNRIHILSTPRVMVKSGSMATIDVGDEVPTITSQTAGTQQNEKIYQQVQYRKTGVLLGVIPVVHSGRRVDLEISQEVSQALPVPATSELQSPSIRTRRIQTSLGLEDGGSILLGGLIGSERTHGYSGVPVLSNIPVLGRLFRVESESQNRKELVMLIIPYVIESGQDASLITEAVKGRLEGIGSEELPQSLRRRQEPAPSPAPVSPPDTAPGTVPPAGHEDTKAPPAQHPDWPPEAAASPPTSAQRKTPPQPWMPVQ